MKKVLLIIFVSFFSFFSLPSQASKENLSFSYNNTNITSWSVSDTGISIEIDDDAKQQLFDITNVNAGRKIEIFFGDTSLFYVTIHEGINSNSVFFPLPETRIGEVIKHLPSDKRK